MKNMKKMGKRKQNLKKEEKTEKWKKRILREKNKWEGMKRKGNRKE
jgi:hypothetical protein